MKNITESARSAVMLDEEISNIELLFIFYNEWHRDARHHQNTFKVNINMIVAIEAANQGVAMGKDTTSGLTFADDFVGDIRTTRRTTKTNCEGTRMF